MGKKRARREVPGDMGKDKALERRNTKKRPVTGPTAIALPQQEVHC